VAKARTLSQRELRKALDHVATRAHAARNRAVLLLTHWAGMRVGEVAALRLGDVVGLDGAVRVEIALRAEQTKGRHGRVVLLASRLRRELEAYVRCMGLDAVRDSERPLFATQKRSQFTANTLCHTLNDIYRAAGLDGASSHSGRRSFITQLASKGVSVRVLAALAGHRSIATTQAYIDVNDAMKRSAVELVV